MKKIILFDFDGTIADTLKPALDIANRYLKENDYYPITERDLKQLRHMNPLQIVVHFNKFPIWKILSLVKHVQKELSREADKIKIFPGVEKLLIDLKLNKYKLAVLSSNLKETIDQFLEVHQLQVFDYVKCDPNILEKAKLIRGFLKEHYLKKEDVVYVGDEIRDIEACRSVGIKIISVAWGFSDPASLQKMKPDFLVRKPTEILSLLKKL